MSYTEKNGKPGRVTLPNKALADAYALRVKGATVEEIGGDARPVTVTVCPVATLEVQRDAAKQFYPTAAERRGYVGEGRERDDYTVEQRGEMVMEYVSQGRLMGGDVNDLLDDVAGL